MKEDLWEMISKGRSSRVTNERSKKDVKTRAMTGLLVKDN
jgi:hypothetical protein